MTEKDDGHAVAAFGIHLQPPLKVVPVWTDDYSSVWPLIAMALNK
jgi:hypothetical protein